ncbi:uncharacterized protein K489DRAFT_434610 [Dissoconium aciculare CBS 342.82]|uniref:Lysine-specific metallo-endopeptidase domain-containing protein n=1 Tax=Dissoconium aciculare CBS 342.82 TaxID=1314786 RepID=A0A6J3LXD9_9PEZI|nr:uncharacterized protein K489DRAFT_434610 [Dissoconium aciculare CBS 342.82]KAF1819302.1 hypothetical protein K489DRAFT_434610 [Dissoconium aciculare CBS 342.82]
MPTLFSELSNRGSNLTCDIPNRPNANSPLKLARMLFVNDVTLLALLLLPLALASSLKHGRILPLAASLASNKTLQHRTGARDLFSIGDSNTVGGCSGQIDVIDRWVEEVRALHAAVEDAYHNYQGEDKRGIRMLWKSYVGVRFIDDGEVPQSETYWSLIGARIARMSQFLDGNGIVTGTSGSPPWLFCDGTYATLAPWDQPVRDKDGNFVYQDEEPITLLKAFPDDFNSGRLAYYVPQLKGYDFHPFGIGNTGIICEDNPRRGGSTTRAEQAVPKLGLGVTYNQFDRHVFLCPRAFAGVGTHTAEYLAQLTFGNNYVAKINLSHYITRSATLYHELWHLTDVPTADEGRTSDSHYPLRDIIQTAQSRLASYREQLQQNPETWVYFATAAYMFLNPPRDNKGNTIEPVVFLEGKPIRLSEWL